MARKVDQLRLSREDQVDRLPVADAAWMMVELDDDEDVMAAQFVRKHGEPPEHIVPHRGYLWLGPVPSLEGGA